MAIRLSTGLKDAMLGNVGLSAALANGAINIYSGSQPGAADNAVTGTLLGQITLDGGAFSHGSPTNGLNWDTPDSGVIDIPAADNWQGTGLAEGVAGWARFVGNPLDDGNSSTSLARLDMSVGKGVGDLQLANVNIVVGSPIVVVSAFCRFKVGQ